MNEAQYCANFQTPQINQRILQFLQVRDGQSWIADSRPSSPAVSLSPSRVIFRISNHLREKVGYPDTEPATLPWIFMCWSRRRVTSCFFALVICRTVFTLTLGLWWKHHSFSFSLSVFFLLISSVNVILLLARAIYSANDLSLWPMRDHGKRRDGIFILTPPLIVFETYLNVSDSLIYTRRQLLEVKIAIRMRR